MIEVIVPNRGLGKGVTSAFNDAKRTATAIAFFLAECHDSWNNKPAAERLRSAEYIMHDVPVAALHSARANGL